MVQALRLKVELGGKLNPLGSYTEVLNPRAASVEVVAKPSVVPIRFPLHVVPEIESFCTELEVGVLGDGEDFVECEIPLVTPRSLESIVTEIAPLLGALDGESQLKRGKTFLAGTFAPAKKRALQLAKTKRGKGTKRVRTGRRSGPSARLSARKCLPERV